MGKIITSNNKVKFEVKDKQDCKLYLGHLLEYLIKKREVFGNFFGGLIHFAMHEIEKAENIDFEKIKDINEFIENYEECIFELDFYEFRMYSSAVCLARNEIINLIGDFSRDKLAISYNNYLDILKTSNISDVNYQENKRKSEAIDYFNTNRNYISHFTSDKLCKWIEYRENQVKEGNAKFEHDEEFNIYIAKKLSSEFLAKELSVNFEFLKLLNEIIGFVKKDFEDLIGKEIKINIIKKDRVGDSVVDITENGFESHVISKFRKHKRI